MNQIHGYCYVHLRRIAPTQYQLTISHPTENQTPIIMICQFQSATAAVRTAHHYEALLDKAYLLGYTLNGYYLHGPLGQILPVSDVFDLDMSNGSIEHCLTTTLHQINLNNSPFKTKSLVQPLA